MNMMKSNCCQANTITFNSEVGGIEMICSKCQKDCFEVPESDDELNEKAEIA